MNLRLLGGMAVTVALASGCGPAKTDQAPESSPSPASTVTATASPSPAPAVVATGPVIVIAASPAARKPSPDASASAWPASQASDVTAEGASASASSAPTDAPHLGPVAIATSAVAKSVSTAPPAPTAAPTTQVAYLPPDAAPRIVQVNISATTVRGGDTVSGLVQTSSNVASVEIRIGGFSMDVPKSGVGRFALTYKVPSLPFFLHRTYPMEIIARNTRGDRATTSLPITVR